MTVKRAQKTGKPNSEIAEIIGETPDNLELQEELALQRIAAAAGDDDETHWEVWVRRVPDDRRAGPKPVLFECALDELDTIRQRLRSDYGNGRYRVQVKRDRVTWTQFDIAIEMPIGWKPAAAIAAAPAAAQPENDGMKILADLVRELREDLRQARAPAAAVGVSFGETLTALKTFHELTVPKATDGGLEMFRQGMAMAKEVMSMAPGSGPAGDGESAFERILGKMLPVFAPLAERLAAAAVDSNAGGIAAVPATQPPALPSPPPPQGDEVTQAINYLVSQAQIGADPKFSVQFVLERVPENILAAMEAQENPFAALAAIYPQVTPYRAWFEALIDSLYESEGDDAPDIAAAHQNGDSGRGGRNPGSDEANAGARAPGAR